MKFIDKLLLKFGWIKTNSPSLKAKAKDTAVINQRSIQMQGQPCYIEGDAIFYSNVTTWTEKKEAAENLIYSIEAFFYAVIGRGGFGGVMVPQNLNADGSVKDHCISNCKREFGIAKEKLKASFKENAPMLEEFDQIKLHQLQEDLLAKDMYSVTKSLKEATLLKIYLILEKYRKPKD